MQQSPDQTYARNIALAVAFVKRSAIYPPPGSDWDDLHQAAKLALWKAAQEWRPERGAFSTFAFAVMRNEIGHWLRDHGRQEQRYERAVEAAQEWEACLEPWTEPDFDGQMTLRLVFRRLSPRYREALLLSVGYGYTCGELAERWGVTTKQADKRVFDAKRAARREAAVVEGVTAG